MKKDWVEYEFKNWARWCNLGGMMGAMVGGKILPWEISAMVLFPEDEAPAPIHEENARRVQKVFDSAIYVERKVLQAEYLSPWKYGRNKGVESAARLLDISPSAYETILTSVKFRVERAFQ